MMIEALMLAALIAYRSWYVLIIVAALVAFRRWPWLANAVADMLELKNYHGMTAFVARLALPAWAHMSSDAPVQTNGTIPGTGGTASTSAVQLPDRDITDDWIVALAEAKLPNGKRRFSASKIHDLLGGHRATVLARVKEIQEGVPPAQFRQDDGSTAPASYPMTKSS